MEQKSLQEALAEFNKVISPMGYEITDTPLQRTEDWHKDRLGLFTGSRMKELMSCSSRASKKNPKDWSTHFWLLDFGETAFSYIIERAIERATGERIQTPTTWQMQWGIDHEDEGRFFTENNLKTDIQEVPFVKFLKNAGASSDGKLHLSGVDLAFEIKCPATMMSHYKLMHQTIDESHPYFWQFQSEMLALKVNDLLFCTYDPRYPEGAQLGKTQTQLSNTHARALMFRCMVGERLVNALIESDFQANLHLKLDEIKNEVPTIFAAMVEWYHNELKDFQV